jgi:hypothetical protein
MRLTFIVFFISLISYSQIPTLDENNTWSIIHWSFWSGGYVGLDSITILGEEVINGKTYKKIYRDGELTNCRLREESGVIFSFEENLNDEKVMIDLNLEVGAILTEDYFCLGGGGGTIGSYHVIEVYIAFIAGANRKVISLEGYDIFGEPFGYFEKWIEGIGSTNGLVPFGYNYDFYSTMTCFSENNNVTYFNGFNQCEPPILSIDKFYMDRIIVYPNPIRETSILQLPPNAEIDQLKIYNISGTSVFDISISSDHFILNNMDYVSGLYFYQVFSKGVHIKTDKFIVK